MTKPQHYAKCRQRPLRRRRRPFSVLQSTDVSQRQPLEKPASPIKISVSESILSPSSPDFSDPSPSNQVPELQPGGYHSFRGPLSSPEFSDEEAVAIFTKATRMLSAQEALEESEEDDAIEALCSRVEGVELEEWRAFPDSLVREYMYSDSGTRELCRAAFVRYLRSLPSPKPNPDSIFLWVQATIQGIRLGVIPDRRSGLFQLSLDNYMPDPTQLLRDFARLDDELRKAYHRRFRRSTGRSISHEDEHAEYVEAVWERLRGQIEQRTAGFTPSQLRRMIGRFASSS